MELVALKERSSKNVIEVERAWMAEQKNACYKVRYDVFIDETGYIQKKTLAALKQMLLTN